MKTNQEIIDIINEAIRYISEVEIFQTRIGKALLEIKESMSDTDKTLDLRLTAKNAVEHDLLSTTRAIVSKVGDAIASGKDSVSIEIPNNRFKIGKVREWLVSNSVVFSEKEHVGMNTGGKYDNVILMIDVAQFYDTIMS